MLLSASKDTTIRIWNPINATCVRVLAMHKSCVTKVLWGGNNLIYSASEDRSIKVWNAETGEHKDELKGHSHWVNTLSLNSDYILRTGAYEPGRKDIFDSKEEQRE